MKLYIRIFAIKRLFFSLYIPFDNRWIFSSAIHFLWIRIYLNCCNTFEMTFINLYISNFQIISFLIEFIFFLKCLLLKIISKLLICSFIILKKMIDRFRFNFVFSLLDLFHDFIYFIWLLILLFRWWWSILKEIVLLYLLVICINLINLFFSCWHIKI